MTFLKIFLALIVVIFIGGLSFLTLTDVPVAHHTVTKTLPNDRFLNAH